MIKWVNLSLILLIGTFTVNCTKEKNVTVVESDFKMDFQKAISNKRIYFGHQSVGKNILSGIKTLDTAINITNLSDSQDLNQASSFFIHSFIGENYKPQKKCDDFTSTIINVLQGKVDIVAMKFCYVDINSKTDVDSLLSYYDKTVQKIKSTFPNIRIVHITAPLTRNHTLKDKFKILLKGDDNVQRNKYNSLLKKQYNNEPIFDLASLEATNIDCSKTGYKKNATTIFALSPEYTDDGGHLNEIGGKYVALKFIEFLNNL